MVGKESATWLVYGRQGVRNAVGMWSVKWSARSRWHGRYMVGKVVRNAVDMWSARRMVCVTSRFRNLSNLLRQPSQYHTLPAFKQGYIVQCENGPVEWTRTIVIQYCWLNRLCTCFAVMLLYDTVRPSVTPRKYAFLPGINSILSQRLLHKMTNSREVFTARFHAR